MSTTLGGLPELLGVAEIAERNGVGSPAVANWQKRYADFPRPVLRLKMGPIWLATEIDEWIIRKWDT